MHLFTWPVYTYRAKRWA